MGKRRLKVELENGAGSRYTISIEGALDRNKVVRLIELVDTLASGEAQTETALIVPRGEAFGKLFKLLESKFYVGSFTSGDLLEAYEDEYGTPAKLSTISTYLSRLVQRGFLVREPGSQGWIYRRVRTTVGR